MKIINCWILLAVTSLPLFAQIYPTKEYVRLGSRVIAIENAPVLAPTGDPNAPTAGETNTSITLSGSANSMWTATSSASWITFSNGSTEISGTTNATTGTAALTYSLGANTAGHADSNDGTVRPARSRLLMCRNLEPLKGKLEG
jgi:hypothetical protein